MSVSPPAVHQGLDTLIRDALHLAVQVGRPEIVSSLEAALSATAEGGFELDVLAGEVRQRGRVVALSRGERTLLIALAIQRRPCTSSQLIELLYPHLDEASAGTQLKVYVHRVRRRLGDPQAIVTVSNTYRLGASIAVDYWQVEAEVAHATRLDGELGDDARHRLNEIRLRLLRRDLSWNGDHEWANGLERRLEALLFDVSVRLGEAALREDDPGAALRFATEISHLDPCDERAIRLTVMAHLAAGDPDAAARSLRRYQRVLREELDAPLSPELIALVPSQRHGVKRT